MKSLIFILAVLSTTNIFAFGGDGTSTGFGGTDLTSRMISHGMPLTTDMRGFNDLIEATRDLDSSDWRNLGTSNERNPFSTYINIGERNRNELTNRIFENRNLGRNINIHNFREYLNNHSF